MDPQAVFDNFRRTVTDHYFDMNGRVGLAQFWYFMLAGAVIAILAGILSTVLFFFIPIGQLSALALLLPVAGMGARRLQDTGRDGKLVWVFIIPLTIIALFGLLMWGPLGVFAFLAFYVTIGWLLHVIAVIAMIVLIYFWIQPGNPGDNQYGPPPPVFDPSKSVSPAS